MQGARISVQAQRRLLPPGPVGVRAGVLLDALHERHVPLSPDLALALARLETAPVPVNDPDWGRAFRRAGEAMGLPHGAFGGSSVWVAAFPRFVSVVAEPLLRDAARRLGAVPLDGPAALDPLPDSEAARIAISREVSSALGSVEVMGQGFWIDAGVALHGAMLTEARRRADMARSRSDEPAAGLPPEPEPGLCRLLFGLEPVFPEERLRQRRRRVTAIAQRKRSGVRPKEGGVTGIRISALQEDLPDAVMSELILPDVLVADRLLHEGLLVRTRPPRREPKRDLLALTLCDRRTGRAEADTLVKAGWADAALRLRVVLAQTGLNRSDLFWAEASQTLTGAVRLPVESFAVPPGLDAFALAGGIRNDSLLRSGLLPDFADLLPRQFPPLLHTESGRAANEAMAVAAFRKLSEPPPRLPGRAAPRTPPTVPRIGDYARVLTVACLAVASPSGRLAQSDWPGFREELRAALPAELRDRVTCAAVLWPDALERGAGFILAGDAGLRIDEPLYVPDEVDAAASVARMLGLLSGWFVDVTLEAIHARHA